MIFFHHLIMNLKPRLNFELINQTYHIYKGDYFPLHPVHNIRLSVIHFLKQSFGSVYHTAKRLANRYKCLETLKWVRTHFYNFFNKIINDFRNLMVLIDSNLFHCHTFNLKTQASHCLCNINHSLVSKFAALYKVTLVTSCL